MSRSTWWKQDSFESHIDQHCSAEGREFVVPPPGTINSPKWDDHRVSLASVKAPAVKVPSYSKIADNGSGSQGVFAWSFSATTEQELYFDTQMPHDWKEGSSIYPHIHWHPSSTDTGSVKWGLEVTVADYLDTIGNTQIMYALDPGDGTTKKHQIAAFDELAMTGKEVSCLLWCRVFRAAADGADDYADAAWATTIDFHYERDSRGSQTEFLKDDYTDIVQVHTIPPHNALILRRAYLVASRAVDADASNYWTIDIVQRHYDGRYITLLSFDNSVRGLEANSVATLPGDGNVDVRLKPELPIMIICRQTGTPDPLDELRVFLVLAQR